LKTLTNITVFYCVTATEDKLLYPVKSAFIRYSFEVAIELHRINIPDRDLKVTTDKNIRLLLHCLDELW
jgi:hypothetical protein